MRINIVRLFAALLLVTFVAPQGFAQDAAGQEDGKEKASGQHYHLGTLTRLTQGWSMDIKYVMTMADGEHTAFIVAEVNGEELKVEMMDLEMNEGVVSYNWSLPGKDLLIVCELESVEEGGWAGECIDPDGEVSLMTMGPMMNHEGDHDDADHENSEDSDNDG